MTSSKYSSQPSPTFLLYGIAVSLTIVSLFVKNWDSKNIPSVLYQNALRAESKPGKPLDLSSNSHIRVNKPCLPYIFYDKPVKTGSTSVRKALGDYIASTGEETVECGDRHDCGLAAEKMCLGVRPPGHLIKHVNVNSSLVSCLHDTGFYHVTSIREPKARILSVFKYNRATPGRHNGIDRDSSFEEFLDKFPRCALFKYYDGLSPTCGSDKAAIEERAESIADRMDEIIEVTEKPVSDLHARIGKYLGMENVVTMKGSHITDSGVPDEVAEAEYVLYNKLRKRRTQLAQQPGKRLCDPTRMYQAA